MLLMQADFVRHQDEPPSRSASADGRPPTSSTGGYSKQYGYCSQKAAPWRGAASQERPRAFQRADTVTPDQAQLVEKAGYQVTQFQSGHRATALQAELPTGAARRTRLQQEGAASREVSPSTPYLPARADGTGSTAYSGAPHSCYVGHASQGSVGLLDGRPSSQRDPRFLPPSHFECVGSHHLLPRASHSPSHQHPHPTENRHVDVASLQQLPSTRCHDTSQRRGACHETGDVWQSLCRNHEMQTGEGQAGHQHGQHQKEGGLTDLISEWVAADSREALGSSGALDALDGMEKQKEQQKRRPLHPIQSHLAADMSSLEIPRAEDKWAKSTMQQELCAKDSNVCRQKREAGDRSRQTILKLGECEDRANSQQCCSSDNDDGYEERRNAARRKRRQGRPESENGAELEPSVRKQLSRKKGAKRSKIGGAAALDTSKDPKLVFDSDMTQLLRGTDLTRLWENMSQCSSLAVGILCVDENVPTQFFSSMRSLSKEQLKKISEYWKQAERLGAAASVDHRLQGRPIGFGIKVFFDIEFRSQGGAETTPIPHLYYLPLCDELSPLKCEIPMAQRMACVTRLLTFRRKNPVCAGLQRLLVHLMSKHGLHINPTRMRDVHDPCIMGWLHEPQLLQRDEREISSYSLEELCKRHGVEAETVGYPSVPSIANPLRRFSMDLSLSASLARVLQKKLASQVPHPVQRVETTTAAILARMQVRGVEFDSSILSKHAEQLRSRMVRCEQIAHSKAGRAFNLGSCQQLSEILYTVLQLPEPGDRTASKKQASTDETALRALAPHHALPGLVLEYRQLQNLLSKWVEADWVVDAAQRADRAGSSSVRCYCDWNQTSTATGRLSSSGPNLQAVTKYTVEMPGTEGATERGEGGSGITINIRDSFVASAGCFLVAVDYSQMELRILAHLSQDRVLTDLMHTAGPKGDVFELIAATLLRQGTVSCGASLQHVTSEERNRAKKVTYGIIYGQTAWGLARQLNCDKSAADSMIRIFLNTFKGVKSWIQHVKKEARKKGCVRILSGRVRPLKGISSSDPKAQADAERKAVNTSVQGFAADLIKICMCKWGEWEEGQARESYSSGSAPDTSATSADASPARLIAQIHDELLFECDSVRCTPLEIGKVIKDIMEGVAKLNVPLVANVSHGVQWGCLEPLSGL